MHSCKVTCCGCSIEGMSDIKYLHAFNLFYSVGPKTLKIIQINFDSFEKAWHSPQSAFLKLGFKPSVQKDLLERKNIDVKEEWHKLERLGIHVVTPSHEHFPQELLSIDDHPRILYTRGITEVLSLSPTLSVVGTRSPTQYGKAITRQIVSEVAQAGVVIVSGMALGVDRLSHEACLSVGQKTIAVLACGLDDATLYPPSNQKFAHTIMQNGCLISEFPPRTPALRHHFPMRNRIISGMAEATLVTEAAQKSGTLITARLAAEQNKDVMVVPGPVNSRQSQGANALIQQGAALVQNTNDVLNILDIEKRIIEKSVQGAIPQTEEEKLILDIVAHEATELDKIIKLCKMNASTTTATITVMEMKGIIEDIGGGVYSLKS